jgi:hypothetical protein
MLLTERIKLASGLTSRCRQRAHLIPLRCLLLTVRIE